MIKIKPILIITIMMCSFASLAGNYEPHDISIRDLINNYAERHGTNFVVSSEVKGRVQLIGVSPEKMSKSEFIDILEYYDFIATRKDRVVYIFTWFEVEYLGKGIGPIWQG